MVLECRKLLTDSNIERIAASVSEACEADRDTVAIKRIKTAIREADTAIENLWKALEAGQAADMITQRIEKRQKDKEELQAQLAIEMGKQVMLSAPDVRRTSMPSSMATRTMRMSSGASSMFSSGRSICTTGHST